MIQAHYRGMVARELAAALREEEETERRRLKRLEEERLAKERTMEESYKAAQVDIDLDAIFTFLAEVPKPSGKQEKAFLDSITADLERMFRAGEEPVRKPSRPAPTAPASVTS